MAEPALVHVEIRKAPVAMWQAAQEHTDELLREFMLIATDEHKSGPAHVVPRRLIDLVAELTADFGSFSAENEQRLADAIARRDESLDLDYDVPVDVGPAARKLGELLDEADEYCRGGEHLLTLATPPDQVRFRRWFLGEFARQLSGEPPLPWPDYAGG